MKDCLFCRIVAGEIPAKKVYEDEHTFAFEDIRSARRRPMSSWFPRNTFAA